MVASNLMRYMFVVFVLPCLETQKVQQNLKNVSTSELCLLSCDDDYRATYRKSGGKMPGGTQFLETLLQGISEDSQNRVPY